MTLIEALIDIAHTAAPEFDIHVGFGADIRDFLEQHSVTKPLIFIGVGPEQPENYNEDGRVVSWVNTFHMFVRAASTHRLAKDLYDQYLALREAFNGIEITTDTGRAFVQIVSGENLAYSNVREASISLLVTVA